MVDGGGRGTAILVVLFGAAGAITAALIPLWWANRPPAEAGGPRPEAIVPAGAVSKPDLTPLADAAPPLTLEFRESQVPGQGLVVVVVNDSGTESFPEITLEVRDQGGDTKTYRVRENLAARSSIDVSLVQLGGRKLRPGDRVAVRAAGYARTVERDMRE